MDWLEERGILDRTLVVVTGDHGDSLGEHGEPTHGIFLYDSTLWVPLLLRWPAEVPAGMQIVGLRSLVDIVPTILELLRLPIPSAVQGRSLLGPACHDILEFRARVLATRAA